MIGPDDVRTTATAAVRDLSRRGKTVAIAESLTGGLVSAALTAVPGASTTVLGGVVVYSTAAKHRLAGVAQALRERSGPVAAETALAMARGVLLQLGADVAVATTGVAGPDAQDGKPPGTVHVAMVTSPSHGPERTVVRSFVGEDRIPGDRAAVREATVLAALALLRAGDTDDH
jgi:nicotinamide-nucleotide amidase